MKNKVITVNIFEFVLILRKKYLDI